MPDASPQTLRNAVLRGDQAAVAALLAAQPELVHQHDPDCFGALPLTRAANQGDLAMVDLLLDHGADPNGKSDWWAGGFGPLPCDNEAVAERLVERGLIVDAYVAAGMGWLERLRAILEDDPSQADLKGGDGQRPLHVAKNVATIDLLVEFGADLEARDIDHGSTPIQYQIQHEDRVRRLLEHGATPDIYTACRWGWTEVAEQVLAREPEALGQTIGRPPFVSEGSEGGHIYLYVIGYEMRPLPLAWKHGHQELIDALLPKASPADKLLHACWSGDQPLLEQLLADDPELPERLPAHQAAAISDAAWEHETEVVRRMLQAGFPIDAPGAHNSTALDRACFHGFADLVELLLAHGASLDVRNEFGGDPLSCCCYGAQHSWRRDGDHLACVKALVAAGAKPRAEQIDTGSAEIAAVLRAELER